jgi:hypothetical protein
VQVDPIKPTFKAPASKRLNPEHEEQLSSFGFIFDLRRYTEVTYFVDADKPDEDYDIDQGTEFEPLYPLEVDGEGKEPEQVKVRWCRLNL